jgi:hypothetical protein
LQPGEFIPPHHLQPSIAQPAEFTSIKPPSASTTKMPSVACSTSARNRASLDRSAASRLARSARKRNTPMPWLKSSASI